MLARPALKRRLFNGYDRSTVDDWIEAALHRIAILERREIELAADVEKLTAARDRDREEIAKLAGREGAAVRRIEASHAHCEELETAARERAAAIERAARATASEIVADARTEARGINERARDEAEEVVAAARARAAERVAQHERDFAAARERFEMLVGLQVDLGGGVRTALQRFQEGLSALDQLLPGIALEAANVTTNLPVLHPEPVQRRTDAEDDVESLDAEARAEAEASDTDYGAAAELVTEFRADSVVTEPLELPSTGGFRSLDLHVVRDEPTESITTSAASPTQVAIEVRSIHGFPSLTLFERALGELSVVEDIHVETYENGMAVLQVQLTHAAPLAALLEEHPEVHATIDATDPSRLVAHLSTPAA